MSAVISSVGLGLILWYGGKQVITGTLSIGDFVAFNGYLTMLIRPLSFIGWVIDRFQRSLVAMRRINEVMEVQPEIRDRAPALLLKEKQVEGHIHFRNLNFSYGDSPVLQGIDLDIPAGATLGVVGRVGAGKTTLARLIPRLIEAGPGQLFIDGRPVEEWPLEELRQSIGYVSQSPFLFSDTIRANVAYGAPGADEQQVLLAAEQAQLRRDVEAFPDGFGTLIGERGVTLSGGQKQRATLGRALILQPRILILDDALSAVDTHTEEAILGHLRQVMKGRTTLLIAHRISTLRNADHIVVLDEGCISEQGNHEGLVALGGLYADLFRRQQLAAELETL
jgi:ATP-binding cassette subfamily B protein